jgi:hypothetical protein
MENIYTKLEELKVQRKETQELVKQNIDVIGNALKNEIEKLIDEDVKIEYTFEIRNEWNTNTYPYCFTSTVYFLTDDAAKIADGRKYDFASEFRLNIHNYGISISKGSVSEYTRKDKFQVARDLLLGKLWGVESQLTEIFMSLFDIDLYKRYNDILSEIREKELNIKRVEKELQREKVIKMLKSNKYLYKSNEYNIFKKGEDGYTIYPYVIIGKQITVGSTYIIDKVTDKTIICHTRNCSWETKRLKIEDYVSEIIEERWKLSQEEPQSTINYFDKDEEEGGNE